MAHDHATYPPGGYLLPVPNPDPPIDHVPPYVGMGAIDGYARDLATVADEYASNADLGEYVAILPLDDADRATFVVLDAATWGDGIRHDLTDDLAAWEDETWAVVHVSGSGLATLFAYSTEEQARATFAAFAADIDPPDDDDDGLYVCEVVGHGYHDDEHPCPGPYGGPGGLLDEIRQAERIADALTHDDEPTWASLLDQLPTITSGHADDLKLDTGARRVWLSRCAVADGEPFDRTVYVEEFDHDAGQWTDVGYFDGDETSPRPIGAMSEAWEDTIDAVDRRRVFDRLYGEQDR